MNHCLLVLDPHVLKIVKVKVVQPVMQRRASTSAHAQPRVEEAPEQLSLTTRNKMVGEIKDL